MNQCIFCKIASKEMKTTLEFEGGEVLAFHDINPQAPAHVLVIPRRHIEKISDINEEDSAVVGQMIYRAKEIASARGWKDYRLVFNNGPEAGQTVYHIHLHLLAGRAMGWPPG